MRLALLGLGVSGVVYLAGGILWVRLVRRMWAEQPGELHPELQALRDQANTWRLPALLPIFRRRRWIWIGLSVLAFSVLWRAAFGLVLQVCFVASLSVWWTIMIMMSARDRTRERRERLGFEPVFGSRFRRQLNSGASWVFGFMLVLGTIGAVCFAGRAIEAALR